MNCGLVCKRNSNCWRNFNMIRWVILHHQPLSHNETFTVSTSFLFLIFRTQFWLNIEKGKTSCRIEHLMKLWVIIFHPFVEVIMLQHFPAIPTCKSWLDVCRWELFESTDYLIRKYLDQINWKFLHPCMEIRDKVDKIKWCVLLKFESRWSMPCYGNRMILKTNAQ
jgi:hypothetical protein